MSVFLPVEDGSRVDDSVLTWRTPVRRYEISAVVVRIRGAIGGAANQADCMAVWPMQLGVVALITIDGVLRRGKDIFSNGIRRRFGVS